MAGAAILSLETYRQEALESRFRERLHKELDKWLDRLEEVMDKVDKPSRLWDITQGIRGQQGFRDIKYLKYPQFRSSQNV